MKQHSYRRLAILFGIVNIVLALCYLYIKRHPVVFNESFWGHAHCMKQVTMTLRMYAHENRGVFPFHTNGYGDALLLDSNAWLPSLTGPGYDTSEFKRAQQTGGNVDESKVGRVYIQGLRETDSVQIAFLFDKLPNPGDHRHFFSRIGAPLVREVGMLDGSMQVVRESQWPEFARKQIELLVGAGISRTQAEMYYAGSAKK
jgi:hypothetical protein